MTSNVTREVVVSVVVAAVLGALVALGLWWWLR